MPLAGHGTSWSGALTGCSGENSDAANTRSLTQPAGGCNPSLLLQKLMTGLQSLLNIPQRV